jgi:4-amino-4-deoxy-L-arabinose transferase-like glycosyltransferase
VRYRTAVRRVAGMLLVGAVALLLTTTDLGRRTFTNNDEARFPVLAQQMIESGQWLLPSLNGSPYVNKPPLLAWLIALLSSLFGEVSPLTAVLPSAAAGLATVFIIYRLGTELWNVTAGRYAAVIAATTQGLHFYERLAMPDMLLTAFGTGSVWALIRMYRRPEGHAWIAFYAALAGGFWVKGPAGLMPLAFAVVFAVARRGVRPVGWLRFGRGLVTLGLLIAPWWVMAAFREAPALQRTVTFDYLLWYLPRQLSLLFFVTPVQHTLSLVFPWAWFLPFALYDAWRFGRGRGSERDAVTFVLAWATAVFIMVFPSQQQRIRYHLPLVPPLALLLGWWLAGVSLKRRTVTLWPLRWTAALFATVVATGLVRSASHGRVLSEARMALPVSTLEASLACVAAVAVVVTLEIGLRYHRVERALAIAAIAAATFLTLIYHGQVQRVNAKFDYGPVLGDIAAARHGGEDVSTWNVHPLPLAFYLREPVTDLAGERSARARAHGDEATIVVIDDRLLPRLREGSAPVIVGHEKLGRQSVTIARATLPSHHTAFAPTTLTDEPPDLSRHLALELMCVGVAVVGMILRAYAIGHGGSPAAIRCSESVMILALAAFPGHWAVFAAGLLVVILYWYLRRHHEPFPVPNVYTVGMLLMAPLPLDLLEDVLGVGHAHLDPLWVTTAAVGVLVMAWPRLKAVMLPA